MKKGMKLSVVATVIVALVYVVYLWTLGNAGVLPVETSVNAWHVQWLMVELSFNVSTWWNLLLFPLVIALSAYCYNQEAIVGKEPRGLRNETQFKYETRLHTYIVTVVATFIALGTMVACAFIFPICSEMPGPLSSTLFGVVTWLTAYVVLGAGMEFLAVLLDEDGFFFPTSEQSLTKKYQNSLVAFAKIGLIKALPFIFGLTCGYVVRSVIGSIFGFFKSIKISFSK